MRTKTNHVRARRVAALACTSFAAALAFALPQAALADSSQEVGTLAYTASDGSGQQVKSYSSVSSLLSDAENATADSVTISLSQDWNTKTDGVITVASGKTYTINLNGHMIDGGWRAGAGNADRSVITVIGTLVVNGGDASTQHKGTLHQDKSYWQADGTGSTVITGGLITGSTYAPAITVGSGSTVKLNDLTVAGNYSESSMFSAPSAGIACYDNAKLELSNTDVLYNYAGEHGAGIGIVSARNTHVTIGNGSRIEHNYTDGEGGGISFDGANRAGAVESSSLSITGKSSVSNNYAGSNGGGIFIGENNTHLTINASAVDGNKTAGSGGGVYFAGFSGFEMTNASVSNNSAGSYGGGLCYDAHRITYDMLSIQTSIALKSGSKVNGNTAAKDGGGIYLNDWTNLTLSDKSVVSSNSAKNGGGIYTDDDDTKVTLETQAVIQENKATSNGGGLYVNAKNTDVTLSGASKISSNTAEGSGGGIYHNASNGSVTLKDGSAVSSNHANDGNGGGIYDYYNGTQFALSGGSKISGNGASGNGGGLYLEDCATVTMDGNSSIERNMAANGAGVYVNDDGTAITLAGASQISYNDATSTGGGICNNDSGTVLTLKEKSCVNSNTATYTGAGIRSNYNLTVKGDSTGFISENTAYRTGGGIWFKDELYLGDVSVTYNNARSKGAGMWCDNDDYYAFELAGKVIIEHNYTAKGTSNLSMSRKQDVCGNGSGNELSADSRIGITIESYTSGNRKVSGNKAFISNFKDSYKKVVFADDPTKSVVRDGNYLYYTNQATTSTVTAYGRVDQKTTSTVAYGKTVTLKTSDYAKDGCTLDYWTLSGVSGVSKVTPKDGKASFAMPANDVVARAHYTPSLSGIELTVQGNFSYKNLAEDAEDIEVSAARLIAADGNSYGLTTTSEIRKALKVTSATMTANNILRKDLAFTIELDSAVLESYGIYYQADLLKNATADFRTSFDRASDEKLSVTQAQDGKLVIEGVVTLCAPSTRAVTVEMVDANDSSKALNNVVDQADTTDVSVDSGGIKLDPASDSVIVQAPDQPGWSFAGWDNLPNGAVVDKDTNAVTMSSSLAAGAKLTAKYEPLASAVSIIISDLKIGESFPSKIESCLVAGANERDITSYIKDGATVAWERIDGGTLGDTVEGDAVYRATITASGDAAGYLFGFDKGVHVTVNGQDATVAKLDASLATQSVTYYVKTDSDESYDDVAYRFPVKIIRSADAYAAKLPSSVEYRLKNGTILSAGVVWGDAVTDRDGTGSVFTVTGNFTDATGASHEVYQTFAVSKKVTVAPVSKLSVKSTGKGKVKVSWGKAASKSARSGVVVRYAASKAKLAKNKGSKLVVKSASAKSKVIKNVKAAKSGGKLFFKVRAYKTVNGKKCYSAWSKVKSVKVK